MHARLKLLGPEAFDADERLRRLYKLVEEEAADAEIRIVGRKDVLEQAVLANGDGCLDLRPFPLSMIDEAFSARAPR